MSAMRSRLVIGLAGSIGAGKGTAAAYFERRYGAEVFLFSDPFRKILEVLQMDVSRANMQQLSSVLRASYGQDILSNVAKKAIDSSHRRVVVIDGARRVSDLEGIASDENFRLLYIDADLRTRYDRVVRRAQNRGDSEKSFEDFCNEENGEAESATKGLKENAHTVINNDIGESEFYAAIDAFVLEHLGTP